MKTNFLFRIAIFAACATFAIACKKDNSSSSNSSTTATSVQTAADDQTMASNESDAISNDADAAVSSSATTAGASIEGSVKAGSSTLGMGPLMPCDATISFDTTSDTKSLTITYSGTSCWGNRSRSGTIVISLPKGVHWRDVGAVVTLTVDVTITRKDGKIITIKGQKTITNTTGGLLVDLPNLTSITRDIAANFTITYPNNTTRTWNSSKHRVFTYNDGIVLTTTGTHSDGTNGDVAEWGTNRFGVVFESRISVPKVIAQSCDYRLTAGENTITRGDNITSVITYGLDINGNPTSCPGLGTYYAQLVWSNSANGKTYTFIFPY